MLSEIYSTNAQVNVTQFHNHDSRDGLYIDSAFTQGAAANLARDLNFNGRISGNVYAQPLYIDNGPGGRPTIIAVTESNNVYALDAVDGSPIWQRNVGDRVFRYDLICPGSIDQYGITGTPIVDLASRALFFNAMITPDRGITKKHLVFSLNTDTGDINPGWPVDVGQVAIFNGTTFTPSQQAQRPALGIVDNILYVPYGGLLDCSPYHGWLVGVPINNPAGAMAWATSAIGGSVWGVGGVASDGTNPFITTGNTFNTGGNWMGGEAVIRFQPGPIFTGATDDYWAPLNWLTLDNNDQDLGSSGPLLVDVPGATPSALVVAMGKDGNTYLLDRIHLGGISPPVASSNLGLGNTHEITQAAATYRTNQGTYVALRASSGMLSAFRITTTNPPDIDYLSGWSVTRNGCGSPFVTSTDGTNNTIVWVVGTNPGPGGSNGDHRLNGYDGDTGAVIYGGGGPNELMPGTHSFSTTGIAARGRIYVATDSKVYAFIVPGGLGNLSTRAFVQTGDNVMIGGFIVQGTAPKRVIVRAIGPELTQYGVPNVLANPTLELHNSTGALIASNDDWQHTIIGGIITQDQVQDIQNSGYAPTEASESAIIANLPPGNYTAIVRGVNNTTGVALADVYDLSGAGSSVLGNISTRSFVQTGDNVMIGGFIIEGSQPKSVIVRAIGPELIPPPYNIPNALADPILELHDGTGALIASNNNWQTTIIGGIITHDQVQDIMNSGHPPTQPSESAIIGTLQPGNYTAIVRGVNDTTGVALVEVYDLN